MIPSCTPCAAGGRNWSAVSSSSILWSGPAGSGGFGSLRSSPRPE